MSNVKTFTPIICSLLFLAALTAYLIGQEVTGEARPEPPASGNIAKAVVTNSEGYSGFNVVRGKQNVSMYIGSTNKVPVIQLMDASKQVPGAQLVLYLNAAGRPYMQVVDPDSKQVIQLDMVKVAQFLQRAIAEQEVGAVGAAVPLEVQ